MGRVELCLPFQGMPLCILSKVQSRNEEHILPTTDVISAFALTASTAAHSPNNQTRVCQEGNHDSDMVVQHGSIMPGHGIIRKRNETWANREQLVDENLKRVRRLGMKSRSYPIVVWMTRSAEDQEQITILIQVCTSS